MKRLRKVYKGALASDVQRKITGCSDDKFKRLITLLSEGATLAEAVKYAVDLNEPHYSRFREGLKNKKAGTSISSMFKNPD